MGILNWRLWDRLDDLDRRTGVRRESTDEWAKRWEFIAWALPAWFVSLAAVNVVQGEWKVATVDGVIAVLMGLFNLARLRWGRKGTRPKDQERSSQ